MSETKNESIQQILKLNKDIERVRKDIFEQRNIIDIATGLLWRYNEQLHSLVISQKVKINELLKDRNEN